MLYCLEMPSFSCMHVLVNYTCCILCVIVRYINLLDNLWYDPRSSNNLPISESRSQFWSMGILEGFAPCFPFSFKWGLMSLTSWATARANCVFFIEHVLSDPCKKNLRISMTLDNFFVINNCIHTTTFSRFWGMHFVALGRKGTSQIQVVLTRRIFPNLKKFFLTMIDIHWHLFQVITIWFVFWVLACWYYLTMCGEACFIDTY